MKNLFRSFLLVIFIPMLFNSFNCYYDPYLYSDENDDPETQIIILAPPPPPPIIILPGETTQPEKAKMIYRESGEENSRERKRSGQTNLRNSDSQRSTKSRRN